MALELHHLHTDGPKPMYKKIAVDEYNRLRDENAELREKVATLEEAQRWRSVSEETPKDGELVFVRFAERGCGHYFPMDVVRWNSSYRLGEVEVTHWMPMPEEPKENDDARKN